MTEIIHLIFFTCVIVLAWRVAISDDMIFERIGQYAERKIDEGYKWHNLYSCPFCMPTVVTFIGWVFMFGLNIVPLEFEWGLVFVHFIAYFSSCFIAGFTWTVYTVLNAWKDKNEAEEEYLKSLNNTDGISE